MRAERHRFARKGLVLATLIVAATGIVGGAYAWWKWGVLVVLDSVVKFCL